MGTKITALGAIPEVANVDVLPIVDLTDTTTKKATITQIEARFTADGFLSALDNISELTNDSGYITVSDFSNDGENAGVDRDLGNLDAFALSFITSGVGRINIEAGGNVGIGTSTPSEVLEVVGSTKISGNITQTDASASTSLAGGDIRFEDNGGGLPTIWLNQTTYDINTASFWQLGSGASTIQARNVPTGGQFENRIQNDVGKGSKLEFPADVHSSWYQVGNAGITHKYFNMGNTGYGLGLRAGTLEINSANDFVFSKYDGATAPTDLIKILGASGNVGIGTATPTEKLEVVGNVFVTGTQKIKTDYLSSNLSLENTSGSSTYEIGVGVAGVSVETLYFNNRLGNRTFGINLDGRFDIIEKVNLEDNIELKWGNNVSYGAFFDANYEQKMTFNNAGGRTIAFDNKAAAGSPNYTFNWSGAIKGNFGIGTTTPSESLEVVGNIKISGEADINGGAVIDGGGTTGNATTSINKDGFFITGIGGSGRIEVTDANGNSFIDGSLTIGTASTTILDFEVQGQSKFETTGVSNTLIVKQNTNQQNVIQFHNGSKFWGVRYDTNNSLYLEGTQSAGANQLLTLGNNNNVGIGMALNTLPTDKLEVVGNLNATRYKVNGVAGANFSGAVTNITVVDGIVTAVS